MAQRDFNNLAQLLKPVMKKRGMSVENLAKKAGLSRMTIYAWFDDSNRPDTQSLARVCKVLKLPLTKALRMYSVRSQGAASYLGKS
jgi:DNA-binding phage protein